eukprot:m.58119 g.58119  ORF g.58119 m.58119 type:complete len:73 (+) comp12159_c0_seq2:1235-1453(+)
MGRPARSCPALGPPAAACMHEVGVMGAVDGWVWVCVGLCQYVCASLFLSVLWVGQGTEREKHGVLAHSYSFA